MSLCQMAEYSSTKDREAIGHELPLNTFPSAPNHYQSKEIFSLQYKKDSIYSIRLSLPVPLTPTFQQLSSLFCCYFKSPLSVFSLISSLTGRR